MTRPGADPGQAVTGVPRILELSGGIAVVGPPEIATAVFRSVAISAVAVWAQHHPTVDPHALLDIPDTWPATIELPGDTPLIVQRAKHHGQLDPRVRSVVVVSGETRCEVYVDGVRVDSSCRPDRVQHPGVVWAARRISQWTTATTQEVTPQVNPRDRAALWLGVDDTHLHDLVIHGPHALVWGQSGRGKTVLIQRLVRDVARRYRPDQVSCVLIDFKGGLGALGLSQLPHLAGVLTDLQPSSLHRVHGGLVAEIARRENLLATHAVANLSDLPDTVSCSRVIIAVDEVGVVVDLAPPFGPLLADIAARGRSLGMHLIVSGQRLTSQVPRGVLVNAGLRWCLGVTDPTEATEYLPGVSASEIGSLQTANPGTVIGLALGHQHYRTRVSPLEPEATTVGQSAAPLWCPELPQTISRPETVLGLVENVPGQRLDSWSLDDIEPGGVLIVGSRGSGVSSAIHRLADVARTIAGDGAGVAWLPNQPAALLDSLVRLAESPKQASVAIIEDFDGTVASCPQGVSPVIIEAVVATMRAMARQTPPGHLIVGARPGNPELSRLIRHGVDVVGMRMGHREQWEQCGLAQELFSPLLAPGHGVWRGRAIGWCDPGDSAQHQRNLIDPHPLEVVAGFAECDQWRGAGVVVCGSDASYTAVSSLIQTDHPQWVVMSVSETTTRRGDIDNALANTAVVLVSLTPSQMRWVVGHERAPVIPAPTGHGWWVGERFRLVAMPKGARRPVRP